LSSSNPNPKPFLQRKSKAINIPKKEKWGKKAKSRIDCWSSKGGGSTQSLAAAVAVAAVAPAK